MTRFARAQGSKSSNKREPEEATSWHEMKQQLLEKQQTADNEKKRATMDEVRAQNYKAFLKENEDNDRKTEWADFPGVTKKASKKVRKEQKLKKIIKNNSCVTDDDTVSKQFSLLKDKIEMVLSEEPEDKPTAKKMKSKKQELPKCASHKSEDDEGIESDDAPEEISAKVKPQEIVVKKKKPKQKKVHIPPEESQTAKNNTDKKVKKAKNKKKKQKKPEDMTEEELAKVEKKKLKKVSQIEKKKHFKAIEAEREKNKYSKPLKPPKPRDDKEHPRRKPQRVTTMTINGKEVDIGYFDGFPVKKEDYDRLLKLHKDMRNKGIPQSEIKTTLKLERRKAEKALAREKKKRCFKCRESGHNLSECPALNDGEMETSGTGICFKCGSTEHTHFECKVVHKDQFKFAQCFICKEQGHIARQCPDNNRGMYPKGGACKVCGDVTHLKKDCPKFQMQQQQSTIVGQTIDGDSIETLDDDKRKQGIVKERKNKIIKF